MTSKIIGGKRYCGKTTELIREANAKHLYILCTNRTIANLIFIQAKDMGLDIPYPITVDDLPLHSSHIKEVLIDEAETVLQQLIGKHVSKMSTSYQLEELPSLREERNQEQQPLLTIELQDEASAPTVFYKGKEIRYKLNVCFEWESKTDTDAGGLAYDIEHYEVGNERITRNRIERAVGDHAY